MKVATALQLFVYTAAWRIVGLSSAGRGLVRALGSDDENIRTLAGMFLVRGGKRAEPLLREALERRQNLPLVITIVGSLGDRTMEPELRPLTSDPDPAV